MTHAQKHLADGRQRAFTEAYGALPGILGPAENGKIAPKSCSHAAANPL